MEEEGEEGRAGWRRWRRKSNGRKTTKSGQDARNLPGAVGWSTMIKYYVTTRDLYSVN